MVAGRGGQPPRLPAAALGPADDGADVGLVDVDLRDHRQLPCPFCGNHAHPPTCSAIRIIPHIYAKRPGHYGRGARYILGRL